MDNLGGTTVPETSAPFQQNAAAPILLYEVPPRTAFAIERNDAQLLIRIPLLSSWRQLHRAHWLALVPIAMVFPLVYAVVQRAARLSDVAPGISIYLLATLIGLLHALYRLTTRTVIVVGQDWLAITFVNTFVGVRTMRWRRGTVHEVRMNPNNGKLLVRAVGRDMAEFFLSPDQSLSRRIADMTQDAVFHGKFEGVDYEINFTNTRRAPLGWLLLLAAAIIGVGGFVSASVSAPRLLGGMIIFVGCLLAMIAVGITFGIQERKFFT